jgi:hypothetical protein
MRAKQTTAALAAFVFLEYTSSVGQLYVASSYTSLQRQKHTVSLKEGGCGGLSVLMTSVTCNHWLN